MDRKFERYLDIIGVSNKTKQALAEGFFQDFGLTDAQVVFKAKIALPHLVSYEALNELYEDIDKFKDLPNGFFSELSFKFIYPITTEELKAFIESYIQFYKYQELANFRINLVNKEIVFEYKMAISANSLLNKAQKLVNMFQFLGLPYKVSLGLVDTNLNQTDINQDNDIDVLFKKETKQQTKIEQIRKQEYEKQQELDRTYVPCKIKDAVTCSLKRVEVCGDIYNLEIREIKDHTKKLAIIYYTDNTYGVVSNLFESKKYDANFIDQLSVGKRIKVKGSPTYDDYSKQVVIKIDSISIIDNLPLRMDNYEGKKRIELHLHSQMSTMDGVGSIQDYIDTATRFNMPAIGLTDHGGVQSFPKLQDLSKGKIKPLYGCELYVVDSDLNISINPQDRLIRSEEYVIFDLETTGLSSRYDRIIEFGAIKVRNGAIVDEVDFFINPDMKLPEVTVNLTHISDDMVQAGKSIKQALKDIVSFIGDACLVAHNAVFDFGFLNEALKNNNQPILTNPVIDTLPLSRFLFQDLKSHTLGRICKKLKVIYDEDSAHRAVYDAKVLKECWDAMENILLNMNQNIKHSDLNNLFSFIKDSKQRDEIEKNIILTYPRPYHVVAYAKSSKGLKDLFEIISQAHINYFNEVPRVPKKILTMYRQDLLLGSACCNGEVFQTAMNRSKEKLEEVMQYYDYIEVQPLANYSFLVDSGKLSKQAVQKLVLDIIESARNINKIVVATSDCHYVDPEDKIFRDVYIFAKGLNKTRHPLNPWERDKSKFYENPDQHFRSTEEMLEEFSFLNDENLIKEIVIDNTYKIADQISEDIHPIHSGLSAPTIDNCDVMLKELVYKTAKEMYGDPLPTIVASRLEAEMSGISANHYEVIYWIASKLVRQANQDGYIVGSRGSVGSSLVATMAKITEVNPLQPHYRCPKCKHSEWIEPNEKIRSGFDLDEKDCPICGTRMIHDGQNIPFATFIGFHAEKTPDIDLNFPPDYQGHAHELTKTLLTKESGNAVYKAGTVGAVKAEIAYGYAKGYYENLEMHPEMHIDANSISRAEILRLANGCIGVKRTTGQHPGGIIVIPRGMDVTDFTPIQYPADDSQAAWQTSHFDFNSMHDTILKLDLLGHVDPKALLMMSKLSNKNLYEIPFNDAEVMSLFNSVEALKLKDNYLNLKVGTLGLPEFGTDFSMNMLLETKPKCFADIVIISGLAHGTNVYAGNQQELIRNGTTNLQGLIGCRDDIMMNLHNYYDIPYEDSFQIMEIVRHGRFNPNYKKSYDKYVKYTNMMQEHKVPDYFIDACNKIAYLFPKGHAVAYCMMAFRVGWFKVHDPLSFYATYFSVRADHFDLDSMIKGEQAVINKLKELDQIKQKNKTLSVTEEDLELVLHVALEMLERGYKFANLSIYESDSINFKIDREHNCLIPPFVALSGVGASVAESVIEARKDGPFISIEDFVKRTRLPAQKIEILKQMGCFEGLPESNQISLFDFD